MKINNFSLDRINQKIFKIKNLQWSRTECKYSNYESLSFDISRIRFSSENVLFRIDDSWNNKFENSSDIFNQIINNFRESRRRSNEEKA